MAAEGDAEVPASPPLLLEMASLRLPDSEEYEFDARRRADNSLSTSSSTDSSPNNLLHGSPRSQSFRQYNRRILYGGDSGGLVDFMGNTILDIMSKTGGLGGGNSGNSSDMGNLLENPMATNNTEALVNGTWASNVTSVGNFTENLLPELFYRHSVTMTAVYCVAYLLVFAVGLVGNCFVIAVVYRAPRMRTVTNFFIVNLAVADILVIVFCLPATLLSNIFVPWLLGWWMCKTVPYIQGVSVAASVYSLIAVSLDRFLAIWWPLKCQITKRRARIMILIIWVIALTTTIPWALYFDLVIIFNDAPDIQLCLEVWPNEFIGALYFLVVNLLFLYILPLIVISLCYILIWFKVWKRTIPSDTKDAQVERMQQKSKVKVVKMLVAVVILFVLSWLPLYVIFARLKLGGDVELWEDDVLLVATPIAQWLGASNSCINPILYAFFNKKYRRGFVAILKSRRCCGRLRYYESINLMSSSVSMRKSSYYVNNNNSSTRRPPGQDTSVSYIYNNTGV